MSKSYDELIEALQAQIKPIEPQDTMAEAGRKALLDDFVKMLHHEAGSRVGEDPEEVHDMRVSIRRMRSTLRLLANYFKPKAIQPYLQEMRKVAGALGDVRDLDVMLSDLQSYAESLDPDAQAALQPARAALEGRLAQARKTLIRQLDKNSYSRFVDDFATFVTKPGKGVHTVELDGMQPVQVRYLLPPLVYEHLGAVRAYDSAVADADPATLHALRIEFKRLRYVVTIFGDVLGATANDFISELKEIQDYLGRIADTRAAKDLLRDLVNDFDPTVDPSAHEAVQRYVDYIDQQQDSLSTTFADVWKHFNTKTVQRQLANAVAGL